MIPDSKTSATSFDVFISYSRRDIDFARKLEHALESYKPPRDLPLPQRYLNVFRDESDFTGVEYFQAVDKHLREASKLLVICSPAARESRYVDDEIRRFVSYKSATDIVPVLSAGLPNNEVRQGFEQSAAFPDALVEALKMPRAIDYRSFNCRRDKLEREGFTPSWYSLLAEIYSLNRDVIEQREKRRRARRRRTVISLVTSVLVVLSAALIWALISRREAIRERNTALARQLAAQAEIMMGQEPYLMERAGLLGAESLRRLQTPEADQIVRSAIGLLPPLVVDAQYPGPVLAAALSPKGDYLAIAGESGIDLFNSDERRRLAHIPNDGVVLSVIFSPDGKWLLTGDNHGKVGIFELPSGRAFKQLQAPAQVTNLVFAPDGTYVAARSSSSTVNLWSVPDGQEIARLPHGGVVQSISLTPDGQQLCAGTRNGSVYVWAWSSRQLLRQMNAGGPVLGIACGASGRVVAGIGKREVPVWGDNPAESGTLQDQHSVDTVTFSPDGRYLATAGGYQAEVWKTDGWSVIARLEHQNNIEAMVFHPQQPLLATASDDRTARIWNIESGSEVRRVSHLEPVLDVNFNRRGQRVVTASVDHSAQVVEVEADPDFPWENGKPTAADFTRDGQYIATGDLYGSVRIWNLLNRQLMAEISVFNNEEITALRFSPDERYLAAASRPGTVSVMDASSRAQLFRASHGAKINSIAIEKGNHWTFTGGEDGKVKKWSFGGQLAATLEQTDPVTDMAVSENGRRLAVTMGRFGEAPHGGTVLWDLTTGKPLRQIETSSVPLQAAEFSSDSHWLVTGGQDNTARLWDATTGVERRRFVHDHPVWTVAINEDAQYVATGTIDRETRIWEITTGRELVRLVHPGPVRLVRFTPGAKHVLTASFDASGVLLQAREWRWRADDLIQQVCSRMAQRLSPEDWRRYVSIEAYDPVCRTGAP